MATPNIKKKPVPLVEPWPINNNNVYIAQDLTYEEAAAKYQQIKIKSSKKAHVIPPSWPGWKRLEICNDVFPRKGDVIVWNHEKSPETIKKAWLAAQEANDEDELFDSLFEGGNVMPTNLECTLIEYHGQGYNSENSMYWRRIGNVHYSKELPLP